MRNAILCFLLLCICFAGRSQTFVRDIPDIYDTVWQNSPTVTTYTPGHGAIISCTAAGAPGWGWYRYNYMTHINDNGDSVWVRRNILDTSVILNVASWDSITSSWVYGLDTFMYYGLVQSVARLGNGNYLVAGNNWDTTGPYYFGYMLRQFDSAGNALNGYFLYDSIVQYERDIKVLPADGTNFYLLYNADSIFYAPSILGDSIVNITWVQKMDAGYHVLWSHKSRYASTLSSASGTNGDINVPGAFATNDTGLAYIKTYDTSFYLGMNKQYLERLRGDGSLSFITDLSAIWPHSVVGAYSAFATHDSGIVCILYTEDSATFVSSLPTGSSGGYIIKFDHVGALVDSIADSVSISGVELSNGNLLFHGYAIPQFNLYSSSLTYLYSTPYPFTENNFTNAPPMIANPWGGAFIAFSGDNYTTPAAWHLVAVNFDSLFQCYPSFVNGNIYQDNNTNCVNDAGDLNIGGAVAWLHDAITGNDYYGFADGSGNYSCNVPNGNYTVSQTPFGFERNECGAYTHSITAPTTLTGNNFADTLVPGIRDLVLWMTSSCIVPGDTTAMIMAAFNAGTVTVDTTMTLVLPAGITYISATPAPLSVSGDSVTWRLHLLSDSGVYLYLNLLVSTSATLGDTMTFSATSPFPDNVSITDDSAVYQRVVVSSFDPNFKSANQPLHFHRNNEVVYTIDFQNTGTWTAKNIVIIDTLDSRLDPATFTLLGGQPMTPKVTWMAGNRLYMRFTDINLPDSAASPAGSHGQVSFGMRVKSTVPDGDTIHNTAYIFFDYNAPIVTNKTTHILAAPAVPNRVNPIVANTVILLYPNPTSGEVNISIPSSRDTWTVAITDVAGRTTSYGMHAAPLITLHPVCPPGIYMVQLTNTATGSRIMKKLVIEAK